MNPPKSSDQKFYPRLGCGCLSTVGILLLMIYPSFDARVRSVKQLEGREILTALIINQAQQFKIYKRFTPDLERLYRGTSNGTRYYQYAMTVKRDHVLFEVAATSSRIASYSGALLIVPQSKPLKMIGGICRSNDWTSIPPTPISPALPDSTQISCPPGSQPIHSMQFSD